MLTRRGFGMIAATLALALSAPHASARSGVETGGAIPAFTAQSTDGHTVTEAEFSGKAVVFEWTNHDCPFVKRHYDARNMQALMTAAKAQSVQWVQVISSAPGEQGHVDAARARALNAQRGAAPGMTLLDPSGAMGRAFDAKTTPHMFVFDAQGRLSYQGAIDDAPRGHPAGTSAARNYVREALEALRAGRAPAVRVTSAYGCSVKYR